ncbi:hypothetical protein Mgra_00004357, partial [Meloidogyne graminicola]
NKRDNWEKILNCDDDDQSDDPDKDDVIELGDDEEEYRQIRGEEDREQRCYKIVHQQLLNQAEMLKNPRKGIFIHLCSTCKEHQMKNKEYLFKAGGGGTFVLTIEICAQCLDKNIVLADYYESSFGKGRAKQCGEGTSKSKTSFEKSNFKILKFNLNF